MTLDSDQINQKTKERYSIYAKFYPILALLAYYIIWRGNIFKHINFFSEGIKKNRGNWLDVATGDGSLTEIALKKSTLNYQKIIALDISKDMLVKAKNKLTKYGFIFLENDVQAIPLESESIDFISCFGGLNSFPSTKNSLNEMKRVLKKGGIIRGSALLNPSKKWRQDQVKKYILQGYQTQSFSLLDVKNDFKVCGFLEKESICIGDVFLFEIQKTS